MAQSETEAVERRNEPGKIERLLEHLVHSETEPLHLAGMKGTVEQEEHRQVPRGVERVQMLGDLVRAHSRKISVEHQNVRAQARSSRNGLFTTRYDTRPKSRVLDGRLE